MNYFVLRTGNEFSVINRETTKVFFSIMMPDWRLAQRQAMDACDQLNGLRPRRVILESPFGSDDPAEVKRNIRYARACLRDSLLRDEAPLASHLLYTQAGVLKDRDPEERKRGITAGLTWAPVATASAIYTDLGVTPGMEQGRARAVELGLDIDERELGGHWPTLPVLDDNDLIGFVRTVKSYFEVIKVHHASTEVELAADADRILKLLESQCR